MCSFQKWEKKKSSKNDVKDEYATHETSLLIFGKRNASNYRPMSKYMSQVLKASKDGFITTTSLLSAIVLYCRAEINGFVLALYDVGGLTAP